MITTISHFLEHDTIIVITVLLLIFIAYGVLHSRWIAIAISMCSMLVSSCLFVYGYIDEKTYSNIMIILVIIIIAIVLTMDNRGPGSHVDYSEYDSYL